MGDPDRGSDVEWSPDGKKLAFVSRSESYLHDIVSTVDGVTGDEQRSALTDTPQIAWSPDGTRVAFDRCYDDYCELRSVDIHSKRSRVIRAIYDGGWDWG